MYLPRVSAIPIFLAIVWLCTPDPTFVARVLHELGIQPTVTAFNIVHLILIAGVACVIDEIRIRGPKEAWEELKAYLEQKSLLLSDASSSEAASSSTSGSINGAAMQRLQANRVGL